MEWVNVVDSCQNWVNHLEYYLNFWINLLLMMIHSYTNAILKGNSVALYTSMVYSRRQSASKTPLSAAEIFVKFNLTILQQGPYSPNIAPNDFFFFGSRKSCVLMPEVQISKNYSSCTKIFNIFFYSQISLESLWTHPLSRFYMLQ